MSRGSPNGKLFAPCAELDAAFVYLYGIGRDDVDYIMETFPLVRRKHVEKYGHYHTKLVILDIYHRMQGAIEAGEPYQTLLDPLPADPRVAHPPRQTRPAVQVAKVLQFRRIERPSETEKYNSCVPILTLKAAAGGFGDW